MIFDIAEMIQSYNFLISLLLVFLAFSFVFGIITFFKKDFLFAAIWYLVTGLMAISMYLSIGSIVMFGIVYFVCILSASFLVIVIFED